MAAYWEAGQSNVSRDILKRSSRIYVLAGSTLWRPELRTLLLQEVTLVRLVSSLVAQHGMGWVASDFSLPKMDCTAMNGAPGFNNIMW